MDGGSDVSTASKYPFYVTLDSSDGLLMGQHVYIEPDHGQGQRQEGIHLPPITSMTPTPPVGVGAG